MGSEAGPWRRGVGVEFVAPIVRRRTEDVGQLFLRKTVLSGEITAQITPNNPAPDRIGHHSGVVPPATRAILAANCVRDHMLAGGRGLGAGSFGRFP